MSITERVRHIISFPGQGNYDDNGRIRPVKAGDITYTPDGCGHALSNSGNTDLVFMALIIKD